MRNVLFVVLLLVLVACGGSRSGNVAQSNLAEEVPPTLGSSIADSTFSIQAGYGGNYNVFDNNGSQYLLLNSANGIFLTRLNDTQLDTNFGTAGRIQLTGTGGVLGLPSGHSLYSMKCGNNLYAFTMYTTTEPNRIFKGQFGTNDMTFTDISGDLSTRLGAPGAQLGAYFCSENHFVVITGRGNNAPTYLAYIAVNTTTDVISVNVDSAGTQDEVMRSTRTIAYNHAGIDYVLQSRNSGLSRKTMTIDETNRTISFTDVVNLTTLQPKVSQSLKFLKVGTETWFVGRTWGNENKLHILKESMASIHARMTANDFTTAPFASVDIPTPGGRLEWENLCFTADGKTFALIGSTSTNITGYYYADISSGTPEIPLAFNNGEVETFPVSYPYASTSGVTHTLVSCNAGKLFFAYKEPGTNELKFDRYTP